MYDLRSLHHPSDDGNPMHSHHKTWIGAYSRECCERMSNVMLPSHGWQKATTAHIWAYWAIGILINFHFPYMLDCARISISWRWIWYWMTIKIQKCMDFSNSFVIFNRLNLPIALNWFVGWFWPYSILEQFTRSNETNIIKCTEQQRACVGCRCGPGHSLCFRAFPTNHKQLWSLYDFLFFRQVSHTTRLIQEMVRLSPFC